MDQLASLNSMATDQMSSIGHKRNQTREDGLEKIHLLRLSEQAQSTTASAGSPYGLHFNYLKLRKCL